MYTCAVLCVAQNADEGFGFGLGLGLMEDSKLSAKMYQAVCLVSCLTSMGEMNAIDKKIQK